MVARSMGANIDDEKAEQHDQAPVIASAA